MTPAKSGQGLLLVSFTMHRVLENATRRHRRQKFGKMVNNFGLQDEYSTMLSQISEQKGCIRRYCRIS